MSMMKVKNAFNAIVLNSKGRIKNIIKVKICKICFYRPPVNGILKARFQYFIISYDIK